jgi:hypothetical protein
MESFEYLHPLGCRVRDRVTGYTGIVDGVMECLNGCIRYSVQPAVKEDGTKQEGWWIDQGQIEFVDTGINMQKPVTKTKTGGPPTRTSKGRSENQ